jgi:hypothetical protein
MNVIEKNESQLSVTKFLRKALILCVFWRVGRSAIFYHCSKQIFEHQFLFKLISH